MIACQNADSTACCDDLQPTVDASPTCDLDQPAADDLVCPRAFEMLTVLNDVFDSFCQPADSGVTAGIGVA